MLRSNKRKTTASVRQTELGKRRSQSQLNRRRLKHLNLFHQDHAVEQQNEPGPSCALQLSDARPSGQHLNLAVRNTRSVRSLFKIGRQPLTLQFSSLQRLAPFTAQCSKCFAKHWIEERTAKSTMQNPVFSMCCANGKVSLPAPKYPPTEVASYLLDQTQGE